MGLTIPRVGNARPIPPQRCVKFAVQPNFRAAPARGARQNRAVSSDHAVRPLEVSGGILALGALGVGGWFLYDWLRTLMARSVPVPSSAGQATLYEVLRRNGEPMGVPLAWMIAFAKHESNLNPNARNCTGNDGAQGCAWGMGQVTLDTARGYGFTGEPEQLLDPDVNAHFMAVKLADARARWGDSLPDAAAYYNSGRSYAAALAEPRVADKVQAYVAKLVSRIDWATGQTAYA